MFVHREGVNPNSMDGVSDLRDHKSFFTASRNLTYGEAVKWKRKCYDYDKKEDKVKVKETWKDDVVLAVTSFSGTQALEDDVLFHSRQAPKIVPLLNFGNSFLGCFLTKFLIRKKQKIEATQIVKYIAG